MECCLEILLIIGLALLFEWIQENPFWGTVIGISFLGFFMVGLPVYWFIKVCNQRMKGSLAVGYFIGFFGLLVMIAAGYTGDFAVPSFCVFIGAGLIGLIYLVIKDRHKKQARRRKKEREKQNKAKAWELEDQLKGLKEQLVLGHITQEEYEQRKKKLLEK